MGKPKRPDMEFRYYELPKGERALALLGDRWKFNYANSLTCRHFHKGNVPRRQQTNEP